MGNKIRAGHQLIQVSLPAAIVNRIKREAAKPSVRDAALGAGCGPQSFVVLDALKARWERSS